MNENAAGEFDVFYKENIGPLTTYLILHGANFSDAIEIAQESMLKSYMAWTRLLEPRAWVYRVADNSLKAVRHRSMYEEPVAEISEIKALLPSGQIEMRADLFRIIQILSRLPFRQRQVLFRVILGFNPAEIAEELDLKAETVRANLRKARQALRRGLERDDIRGRSGETGYRP